MKLREGTFLHNRYEVIDRIGSGGMSEVYKARDHKLNRLVAVKILKEEFCSNTDFVDKFRMEAQASAGLQHANIVNVYDVVDEGQLHCIIMELVEGVTLKNFIHAKGRLDLREAIVVSIQASQGIQAAHERGIIHRDIKPQNIIMSSDGKVKVADFGIARAASSDTLSSTAMGSVHYLSPEQAKGEIADERSDIYSLGITMFEMITGHVPFDGDNTVSIAIAQIEQELPLPGDFNRNITPAFETIIMKCCQKKPERRYQNVSDLIVDLRKALVDPMVAGAEPSIAEPASFQTKVISQEELGAINARTKAEKASEKYRTKDDADEEEIADRSDKTIAILGIILAVVVVIAAILIIGRFTGMFSNLGGSGTRETIDHIIGGSDKVVEVPDVRGKSYDVAKDELKQYSLDLKVEDYAYSDEYDKDFIISQNPEAGSETEKYSKITVILSNGSNKIDLTGLGLYDMTGDEARALLLDKGFDVKIQEIYHDSAQPGSVIAYEPSKAEKNSRVILTVSKGRAEDMSVVPSIIGLDEDTAVALIAESGLTPGEVTLIASDTVPIGLIISQTVLPDTSITKGTPIGYAVSAGPETKAERHYLASLDSTYNVTDLIGPGAESTTVNIMVRLHQVVDGADVYTTLMEPRTIKGNTLLPLRFKAIEGAFGVDNGEVEVVNTNDGQILKSFPVEFFNVE